jgi:ADP-ribosylglycohydrolase
MIFSAEAQDRILGGLWGAIAGDALGVPVEFSSRDERKRAPVIGMQGYGTYNQPPGSWSDDSSLMLCTVEALSEEAYRPERLAELFLTWQDDGHWTPSGKVFDIGITTSSALSRLRIGVSPEEAGGDKDGDNGNGSLMRILPVALRYAQAPPEEMITMAHRISSVTHRHPRSQMACGLYCCMVKKLLLGAMPHEAYLYMIDKGRDIYNRQPYFAELSHFAGIMDGHLADAPEQDIRSSGYVVHTLEASIWCFLTTLSFQDAVLKAVNLGGDTDTTGCVTGGLAGVYYGMKTIPDEWLKKILRAADIDKLFMQFLHRMSC